MRLTAEKSLCKKNQAIIVSRDKGEKREHRAINPERKYSLRHYKLDGDLVENITCCDFLLVNDSTENAYLIELKGGDIIKAIEQLRAGEEQCKGELQGFKFFYRIVCSKARTHQINGNTFRKFKEKYGDRFEMKTNLLEEKLK